jgi:hypothetical protein
MSRSLLAAIHNAVVGPVDAALDEGETGAAAHIPTTKESTMSKDSPPAGGDPKAGNMVSQADHDAAVTAARSEGKADGEKAATDRLSAALGADGVKGDAGRMAAALDLAVKSPAMAGADVAAFIVANVSSAGPSKTASADKYGADRVAAAGLAQPTASGSSKKATIDTGGIYASRRKQQEG